MYHGESSKITAAKPGHMFIVSGPKSLIFHRQIFIIVPFCFATITALHRILSLLQEGQEYSMQDSCQISHLVQYSIQWYNINAVL